MMYVGQIQIGKHLNNIKSNKMKPGKSSYELGASLEGKPGIRVPVPGA